jgi:hypothetical protein
LAVKSLVSPDGRFKFILQGDGNLVLYGPQNQPLWTSGTAGHTDVYDLVMQSSDGNLVIYDRDGNSLWASGTTGFPGSKLVVQNDGNAIIYGTNNQVHWATDTVVPVTPSVPSQRDRLLSNEGLMPGQSLVSPGDSGFTLTLQLDGNLVQYSNNKALWATNTAASNIWDVIMQGDGNLVVFDAHNHVLWASGTSGSLGSTLIVQGDGNLVIYNAQNVAIWSTGPK